MVGLEGNHCVPGTCDRHSQRKGLHPAVQGNEVHPPIRLGWVMGPRPHSWSAAVPGWEPRSLSQTLHSSLPSCLLLRYVLRMSRSVIAKCQGGLVIAPIHTHRHCVLRCQKSPSFSWSLGGGGQIPPSSTKKDQNLLFEL